MDISVPGVATGKLKIHDYYAVELTSKCAGGVQLVIKVGAKKNISFTVVPHALSI